MDYTFDVMSKKSLPDPMSQHVSPVFCYGSFEVFGSYT